MKIWHKFGTILLSIMLLVAILDIPVLADGPDDVVIFGDNYTLEQDQVIKGDLLVYGGNVTLEKGSQVKGNVQVFGGNLLVDGEIAGDVTVWGGNVTLDSEAIVRGDLQVIGGTVTRDQDADVRGSVIEGVPFVPPSVPMPPRIRPRIIGKYHDTPFWSGLSNMFRNLMSILVITVLGILVVVFIPHHTDTVAETMIKAPVQSLGSGILAVIVIPIVAIAMAITLILIPASLALVLVAGIGSLFGWIAAGLLFGTKLLRALIKREPNPVSAVALGMPMLSVLGMVPCIGWAISLITWLWGLGAVGYSLFGTRAYNEPMPQFNIGKKPIDYDPRIDRL